jgi:hypothetical protein
MRQLTLFTLLGLLAVSAPALADPASSTPSPGSQCRMERSDMGLQVFRQTYGTNKNRHNAMGKCVSKRTHATEDAADTAKQNASQACKAEKAADPAAFAQKYGTGKKGANAHGKCVSQKARSETKKAVREQVEADVDAAKACKQERAADREAFADKYGTNANKRNAFAKCVSKTAKTQPPSSAS